MSIKKLGINRPFFFVPTHHRKLHEITQLTENPLTCPIERAVLVSVQADHLTDGPNVVPQHDALSLHHEEVCVGWRKDQKTEEAVKALRTRRRNNRGRWRSSRMRREGAVEGSTPRRGVGGGGEGKRTRAAIPSDKQQSGPI